MQRQKSILSFLKKPSSDNHKPINGNNPHSSQPLPHFQAKPQSGRTFVAANQSSTLVPDDIRGTDTPPEKVPRPIFPLNSKTDDDDAISRTSLFSSIMHKFVKPDPTGKSGVMYVLFWFEILAAFGFH